MCSGLKRDRERLLQSANGLVDSLKELSRSEAKEDELHAFLSEADAILYYLTRLTEKLADEDPLCSPGLWRTFLAIGSFEKSVKTFCLQYEFSLGFNFETDRGEIVFFLKEAEKFSISRNDFEMLRSVCLKYSKRYGNAAGQELEHQLERLAL